MNEKMKHYLSIAVIVFVSISAFYIGKGIVEYIYKEFFHSSSVLNPSITDRDVREGAEVIKKSSDEQKEKYVKICMNAAREEAKKNGTEFNVSDYKLSNYCRCALDDVAISKDFDGAVLRCAKELY